MRTLFLVCGLVFASLALAAAKDVRVFIAPRSALVADSGKVVFDVYWFNSAEKPRAIPNLASYSLSQEICSRSGKTLPRLVGGVQTVDHRSADRTIRGRTMLHDQIVAEVQITADEFAEISAEFWGIRCGTFKSNTVILTKAR